MDEPEVDEWGEPVREECEHKWEVGEWETEDGQKWTRRCEKCGRLGVRDA